MPVAEPVAAGLVAGLSGLFASALGEFAGEAVGVGVDFDWGATVDAVSGGMALLGGDPTAGTCGTVTLAAVVGTAFEMGAATELEASVFLAGAGTALGLADETSAACPFDTTDNGADGSTVVVTLGTSLPSLATGLLRAAVAFPGRRTINVPMSTPTTRTAAITPTATATGGHGDRFCFCGRGRLSRRGRAGNFGTGVARFGRETRGGSNSIVSTALASTSGTGFGDFSARGESFKKAVSALAKSRIEGKRSAGFFRIARSQIAINSGERSGRNSLASGGS